MARRKKNQPTWWVAFVLLVMGTLSFLNQLQGVSVDPVAPVESTPVAGQAGNGLLPPASSEETIRIASFNIQVFGQAKMSDATVVDRLAEIVRQFDLVAIQEIRSVDQSVLPEFVKVVNSQGADYRFVISPRLGRTHSKEQFAYVYRGDLLEVIPGSVFTVDDPEDMLHREPFVSRFRVRQANGEPFTFTLINVHTDPDDTAWEVGALAEVYKFVAQHHHEEDDIILLGDLNVDNRRIRPLTRIPVVESIVPEGPTNTRLTRQYDHILINRLTTTEFTGNAGVFDMEEYFQITREEALKISDHLPVWAEFSTIESTSQPTLATPGKESLVR